MENRYLIVDQKILPAYFKKVIVAKELLRSRNVATVTEAARTAGISRNTFYKYKDYVFPCDSFLSHHKAGLSLSLKHTPGALNDVLTALCKVNASILTISQASPVNDKAAVTIVIDFQDMRGTIEQTVSQLKKLKSVCSIHLDSVEYAKES